MAYQGGNLKSTSVNGVKVYTVIGQQRSTATWLTPKKQRALRKNDDYLQRVELIQDLKFETATTKIKVSPDGEFFIASGIYPPQMKVYELKELSLKFERHLVSEIVDFQILSDDYSKLAFLCADRSVRLHAKYGSHYSLRIPRMGRDIDYDSWSCDLLCAASSPDLYRINLEQGRFLSSLNTQSPALNVVSRSKLHGLVACGGDDGAVECFDMRVRSSVGRINAAAAAGDGDQEVTAVEFDGDGGYHMAVGSSAGKVMIYDLRSSCPLRIKDHMYGSPILDIKWHHSINSEQAKLITTDRHIVRIWDPDTGEGMTSIEPTGGGINDICVFKDSGLILLALDSSQMPSYFIPDLGPAPKWCSYLENLTEEMEEGAEITIYDNFKFLTKEDLERLNLTNLIGTNLLRAHMHGYFIDHKLYKKAKSLSEPFAFEAYREQFKKEKLEAERASRITPKRKLPKVNSSLVEKILREEENEKKDDGIKKPSKKRDRLKFEDISDPRFKLLTENKDYQIDETSFEFMALHPIASQKQPPKSLVDEHFEPVTDDEEDENSSDSDASDRDPSSRAPRLHEVKDERHADAFGNRRSLANEDSLPIGERVAALDQGKKRGYGGSNDVKIGPGGSREISFRARRSSRYDEDDSDKETREKRRGVHSLGLKSTDSGFQGRGRGRGGRGGGRGGGGRGGGRGRSGRGGGGRGGRGGRGRH